MNQFQPGDIVVRTNSDHNNMDTGDMATVKIQCSTSVYLKEYTGGHDEYNLRLATAEERAKFLGIPLEPNYQIF